MDELKYLIIFLSIGGLSTFLVLFICLLIANNSGDNSTEVQVDGSLSVPFQDSVKYTITSEYGYRKDPINEKMVLHDGIDVAAPQGTEIVASASGTVVDVGYQENGLGNYVYIEHNIDGTIYYTAYGHMLDDSIVVTKGQKVKAKEKLGIIGQSGRATGTHVHFSLLTPKLKWDKDNLKDPMYIFEKKK